MTIASRSQPRTRAPVIATTLLSLLLTAGAGAWSGFKARRRARAALDDLSAMSDATLKDIGLHRSDIMSMILG